MIRIGFFGTPELSRRVLEDLLKSPQFEVAYAVTQPDKPVGRHAALTPSPVKTLAQERGLRVFTPDKIRGNSELYDALLAFSVDYLAVVAYGKILPPEVLSLAKKLPVNIHGSLLPKYRWASPIQSALLAGEKVTGITIMRMTEGMDEGEMLATKEIPVDPEETSASLFEKFEKKSGEFLIETLLAYEDGKIQLVPQNDAEATYCAKISKEDGLLDFSLSADETYHRYQAYTPWPGLYGFLDGKRVKLLEFRRTDKTFSISPGRLEAHGKSAYLGLASGILEVATIQLEGKSACPATEFLRGRGGGVGLKMGGL